MKNFAVIGNPISQSLSPLMHNWIFNTLGLDAKYTNEYTKNIMNRYPFLLNKSLMDVIK